jgi:Tfp pilus assembly PilM family ATPase
MVTNLITPKFPRNGLAISQTSIAVVQSSGAKGSIQVGQHAEVTIPAELLRADFTAADFESTRLQSLIRECAERAGLADKKNWNLALPHGVGKVSAFSLDSDPKSTRELHEIIEWKASAAFGVDPNLLRLATEKISNDVDGKTRYLVSAVSKEVLVGFEELLAGLGWNLGLVLPRPLAETVILDDLGSGDSLLLSFSDDGFNGMILRGTDPLIIRNVTCSEDELSDELYRLVLFYSDRFGNGGGELSRLLATGTRFDLQSLAELCSEALGYHMDVIDGELIGMSPEAVVSEAVLAASGVSAVSA